MTHQVIDWYPHRVLCKRFNIPDPYPKSVNIIRPFRTIIIVLLIPHSSDTVGIPNSSSQPPSTSSINWRQNMSFEPSTTINPIATINTKQEEMETDAKTQDITVWVLPFGTSPVSLGHYERSKVNLSQWWPGFNIKWWIII